MIRRRWRVSMVKATEPKATALLNNGWEPFAAWSVAGQLALALRKKVWR